MTSPQDKPVRVKRPTSNDLAELLSEGLDLCVRAKKLDEAIEKAVVVSEITGSRCLTPALWIQDHYDRDLADWEERAKTALIRFMPVGALRVPALLSERDT